MKKSDFLKLVRQECKKAKVKLVLDPGPFVTTGGVKVSGYFSTERRVLAVATGKPEEEWFLILAHEFGHLCQLTEKSKYANEPEVDGVDYGKFFELWLGGHIELTPKQLKKYVVPTILMEQDCEKRVVKFIKKYNLPIDPGEYMKNANAYVLSYFVMMKTRKWPKTPAYKVKAIIQGMPASFDLDYSNPPRKLINLIKKHLK